ncbi:MAG: bifunctional adenosylcobinamide kinase/adenosylcobinamide-phosphate guanylyltransferase [Propionibacteriaceae bacterium]|nr:bifunctional adenosylcobinamide kinase/adenosylcobinamide-phosphate guanylyltransferase [Propionibacteriaceae bacterium]
MGVVIGANGSGKSTLAEAWAVRLRADAGGRLLYLATTVVADADGQQRVARHRRQRQGLGFLTVESPTAELAVGPSDVVLLEDVSNLVANLMFADRAADPARAALDRLAELRRASAHLIAVTIGGLVPQPDHWDETRDYLAALESVNTALVRAADQVIETSGPESEAAP